MGILDTLKDVAVLVQKADNIDLMKGLIDVQTQAYSLLEENQRLKEDVRRLKEEQATQAAMEFRKNSYWAGEVGPLCSRCWDVDRKQVRLTLQRGYRPQCPNCSTVAPDPEDPGFTTALTPSDF